MAALVAVAAVMAAGAACHRQGAAPSLSVSAVFAPQPLITDRPSTLRLTLQTSDHQPIVGAAVEIEARMTHPGMAPLIERAIEESPGVYRATLTWSMAGDWVVEATGHGSDGRPIRAPIDTVRVVPSP